MMTVHKIGGGDVFAYSRYLAAHAEFARRGDYYLSPEGDRSESIGTWHGRGTAELGLAGDVTREQLLSVWEGKDPETGEILIRRSAHGEHVAAVDCTFSAPKSVSVVWVLSDTGHRAEIEGAQRHAVEVALAHIEDHAPIVRRRVDGAIRHEEAGGLVIARFRHHTSRSSARQHTHGQAPDPQLHDHCTIANVALRQSGALAKNGHQWAAIDSRELYRIAAEAGAVYRAELASDLQEMGYRVHREGRYVEVTGISKDARRTFSHRAQEVEAATARFVARHGRQPTTEEARNLVVLSRQPKSTEDVSAFQQWRDRAAGSGLTPADALLLRGSNPGTLDPETVREDIVREVISPGRPHAPARQAVFDERTLRIAVAEAAQGRARGSDVPGLISLVASSPEIVRLDDIHFTTQVMLDVERDVLVAAAERSLRMYDGLAATPASVDAAVSGAQPTLTTEQHEAVLALTDNRALALLTTTAGAGKVEVLRVVTEAYRQDGHRVIVLAPPGDTAQQLAAGTGADEARTVDAFLHRATAENPPDITGAVLVIDAAGLLETPEWHSLLSATHGAKLLAAGDRAQLSPVATGGLWLVLEQRLGAATLSDNHRDGDAWTALREGRSIDTLRSLEERGQIILATDRQAAIDTAVDRWDNERAGRSPGRVLLLTDSSNAEVDALNAAAQERRLAAGELSPEPMTVVTQYPDSELTREEHLHIGDVITFERRVHPAEQHREDRADIRSIRRIENGEAGIVTDIDSGHDRISVHLRDRTVTLRKDQIGALRLGYAQDVYSARAIDRAVVLLGDSQTDREDGAGMAHARETSVVVTDFSSLGVEPGDRDAALRELAAGIGAGRAKVAAVALADRARDAELNRD